MPLHSAQKGVVEPALAGVAPLAEAPELAVVQPVRIYAGMRIGQLFFHRPEGEILHQYTGKYQNQAGATASRAYRDREWGLD